MSRSAPKHDLRAQFGALRRAVANRDRPGTQAALEAIEATLQQADPLTRATGFAQVQLECGRPLKAAEVLNDLLNVIGDDARVLQQMGAYQEAGADTAGAIQSYARATAIDPRNVAAWVAQGRLHDQAGAPEHSLRCYRNALLADPQSVDAWRNLGNVLAARRDYEEALAAYETGLGLAIGDRTLALLRASAVAALGDLDRANRLLCEPLRHELGEFHIVELGTLRCRYHARASERTDMQYRARALLRQQIAATRHHPQTVNHRGLRYLCDPDPVYPARAHRLLDATATVRATAF